MNKIKVFISFEDTYKWHECLKLMDSLGIERPDVWCCDELFVSSESLRDPDKMSQTYLLFGYKFGTMLHSGLDADEVFYMYMSPEDAILYKLSKP